MGTDTDRAANAGDDAPGADTDAVKENKSMKGSVSVRRPAAPNLDANEKTRRRRHFLALPLEVLLEVNIIGYRETHI